MDLFHINQDPLDKWTTREQLFLVTAVSKKGDQDWHSISSMLKNAYGANRPEDWFSQKYCAIQYTHLINNLSNTPTDLEDIKMSLHEQLQQKLTTARIQELRKEMRKQQEDYAEIHANLKLLNSDNVNEDQILELWRDINQRKDTKRVEEMKLENQMREREQRKKEMARNWQCIPPAISVRNSEPNTTAVDMDVEEMLITSKSLPLNTNGGATQTHQTAPSPLLSSLLKTPTVGTNVVVPTVATVSARATAPTITTLLTSGSIPNPNQPVLTLKKNIPTHEAVQLLTRPISGLPADVASIITTPQNLLSPSQSAPTLSMLLEKNKTANTLKVNTALKVEPKAIKSTELTKKEQFTTTDVNHDEVPMDIEKDIVTTQSTSSTISTIAVDVDETDPNEEQQLMEVFKNIGNIDELDIDVAAVINEEVDFLKDVGDDSEEPTDTVNLDTKEVKALTDIKPAQKAMEKDFTNLKGDKITVESDTKIPTEIHESSEKQSQNSIETRTSSDDSIDNIPLATVASQENKEQMQSDISISEKNSLKEKVESALKNEDHVTNDDGPFQEELENSTENSTETNSEDVKDNEQENLTYESIKTHNVAMSSPKQSENSNIILIPTDDDDSSDIKKTSSNMETITYELEDEKDDEDKIYEKSITPTISENTEDLTTAQNQDVLETENPALTENSRPLSIADTDEDSSTTDVSLTTRKVDKLSTGKKRSGQKRRRSIIQNEQKLEDETTNTSILSIPTRQRRRYSSTKAIESFPNSPASSDRDERETRSAKKPLMAVIMTFHTNKNLALIQRALTEEKLDDICLRPMDLQTIKRNIETGALRNLSELQRDLLLMCQNVIMHTKKNSTYFMAALNFKRELETIKEFQTIPNTNETKVKADKETKTTNTSNAKSRTSSTRKSLRIT